MDFRLQVGCSSFKLADENKSKELLFEMLNRSLSMLLEKGICVKGIQSLKNDLSSKVSIDFS